MVAQFTTEKISFSVQLDWETAARLLTVIKGRTMPAIAIRDRKVRKPTRKMSVNYYIVSLLEENLRGVQPDAESVRALNQRRDKLVSKRKVADRMIRQGANRKPKSEWKKPGRIAGKVYPKYEEAMKRVNAEKRRAAALRKAEAEGK